MSAYMVDREHIQYLVDAAMSRRMMRGCHAFRWRHNEVTYELHPGDYEHAALVGQMLWDENAKSIRARYPDTQEDFANAPGPIGESFIYDTHSPLVHEVFDPVQVIKSCHCFAYQACEHEGWKDSQSKAFIDSLERSAVRAIKGYEEAKWGAPEPLNV